MDDVQSECGLDGLSWHCVFQNDGVAAEAEAEAEAAGGGGGGGGGGAEAVSAWSTPQVRGGIGLQITALASEVAGFVQNGEFTAPVRDDARASN